MLILFVVVVIIVYQIARQKTPRYNDRQKSKDSAKRAMVSYVSSNWNHKMTSHSSGCN